MAETKRLTVPSAEAIMGMYFPMLDHGFIALKDYMGGDESVEEAARLSYQGGTRPVSKTRGLIRHLRRSFHTTPSEMVEIKVHVCMPMFVARQWVRHRTASINEMSGRYSLLPMLFYTPKAEDFGVQSKGNKQGRGEAVHSNIHTGAVDAWNRMRADNRQLYEDLAAEGVARELARIDLPLSTYTQWYWKIDLHNLLGFLRLRADSHAQYEIRVFANWLVGLVKRLAPLTYESWIDYVYSAARFSRMEMELLQKMLVADDTEVVSGDHAQLGFEDIQKHVGTKREAREFLGKLRKRYLRPGFDINEADGRAFEIFEAKMNAATPKIDAKPAGTPT